MPAANLEVRHFLTHRFVFDIDGLIVTQKKLDAMAIGIANKGSELNPG